MHKTKIKSTGSKWPLSGNGSARRRPGARSRRQGPSASSDTLTEFCRRLQLFDAVDLARCLAEESFRIDGPITLDLQTDPETSDEWVAVSVTARGEIEAIADAYDAYTKQWLRKAPEHARGKVRLSLGTA